MDLCGSNGSKIFQNSFHIKLDINRRNRECLTHGKQIKAWIRSQHLICDGTDFIFETVDQTQLEKFELCIESMGEKSPRN